MATIAMVAVVNVIKFNARTQMDDYIKTRYALWADRIENGGHSILVLALLCRQRRLRGRRPRRRTMPTRLSEIVNVKDWGATGAGGATNDEVAIQKAINYCMSVKTLPGGGTTQGGIVFFPPGTYNVTNPTSKLIIGSDTLNSPVILRGCGKLNTTIAASGNPGISGGVWFR
jgi:hypothetical protein